MTGKFRRLLPHGVILICNIYIVFYLIDRVNSAMAFINNGITKALLLVMCIISIINSVYQISDERRRIAARNRRRAEAARAQAQSRRAAPPRSAGSARSAYRNLR